MEKKSKQTQLTGYFKPKTSQTQAGCSSKVSRLDSETNAVHNSVSENINKHCDLDSSSSSGRGSVSCVSNSADSGNNINGRNNVKEVIDKTPEPCDISISKETKPMQPKLEQFPRTHKNGRSRSFNSSWYSSYPLLEYSVNKDMVYCFSCRHFAGVSDRTVSPFITGFNDWKRMGEKFTKHFDTTNVQSTHMLSQTQYTEYLRAKQYGSSTVAVQINSQHKTNILRNREIVSLHTAVVLLCAQQDIPLRGHRENSNLESANYTEGNRGNFIAILDMVKRVNPDLYRKAFEMPANAKYTSSITQNELITISARLVRRMIISEIKDVVEYYSVIADETKDISGTEQLSVCVRYVYGSNFKERFLGFMDLHEFGAENISDNIATMLTNNGLSLGSCVAQSYDGASVMSGCKNGVQKMFEAKVGGLCPYIHCYAHRLNLVLVDSCKAIKEVDEFLGLLQAAYNFQSNSVKRGDYFANAQKCFGYTGNDILKIPQSCHTRWFSKLKGIQYFKNRLGCVIAAFEDIVQHGKSDEAAECKGYLYQFKSFKCVLLLYMLDDVVSLTNSLSEYLQCPDLIFSRATALCSATVASLKSKRTDVCFNKLWDETETLSNKLEIDIPMDGTSSTRRKSTPKRLKEFVICSTTGNRDSSVEITFKDKYKLIYFAIIDKFIAEMNNRLSSNDDLSRGISASDPKQTNFLNVIDVTTFVQKFQRFDINIDSLKAQIPVAKNLLLAEKCDKVVQCFEIMESMKGSFRELFLFYTIVLCIPVSSATGERSFSTLNRIKTCMRSTMAQGRTSDLTILSIERDLSELLSNDPEKVVDEFGKSATRRIDFVF